MIEVEVRNVDDVIVGHLRGDEETFQRHILIDGKFYEAQLDHYCTLSGYLEIKLMDVSTRFKCLHLVEDERGICSRCGASP